jgi:hypothetical protein
MPVLPRRRDEIGEPVEELKRRELDDAIGSRPRGLPPATPPDPVGGLSLSLPSGGPLSAKKTQLLRMEFTTFRRAMLAIPAQIVKTGRRFVYRVLNWNPWLQTFFRLVDQLARPMRC